MRCAVGVEFVDLDGGDVRRSLIRNAHAVGPTFAVRLSRCLLLSCQIDVFPVVLSGFIARCAHTDPAVRHPGRKRGIAAFILETLLIGGKDEGIVDTVQHRR